MIRNEREYEVTRSWAKKFEAAAAKIGGEPAGGADKILEAERAGLQSQADEMKSDVAEYEALKSGTAPPANVGNIEEPPDALIKARIALGMTQRELAEKMGMRERQIQRYEQTGYESAGHAQLLKVRAALSPGAGAAAGPGTECGDVPDGDHAMSRIEAAGLKRRFVDECIVGGGATRRERAGAREKAPAAPAQDIRVDARKAARERPARDAPRPGRAQAPGWRRPRRRPRPRRVRGPCGVDTGGGGARRAAPSPMERPVQAARRPLGRGEGAITLARLVGRAWDAGIAVAHLPPALAFHAAYFGGEGAGAAVLSRGAATESRLMFGLAHEMCHAARGRDSIDADEHDTSAEESEANRFAHAVLVGPRADPMFRAC